MFKRVAIYILIFGFLFAGVSCGIIPKSVEFFQDKVKPVPRKSEAHIEKERQAAQFVKNRVDEAFIESVKENASTNVTEPLFEAKTVIEPLSLSLGPPKSRWDDSADLLAIRLERQINRLSLKLEEYREEVAKNEGKKIEGSGLFSIPYFVYVGIVGGIILFVWIIVRAFISYASIMNPPLGVGLKVAQISGKAVKQGFHQLLIGGEQFKNRIKKVFGDNTDTTNQILELFRDEQMRAQSPEIQETIKELTRK